MKTTRVPLRLATIDRVCVRGQYVLDSVGLVVEEGVYVCVSSEETQHSRLDLGQRGDWWGHQTDS